MGSESSLNLDFEALRSRFEAHGQGHVFRFWERLSPPERERLLGQAAAIDLPALLRAVAAARAASSGTPPQLEPVAVERTPEDGGDPQRAEEARGRGERLLAEGRVALLVVAGGQATRLGYPGPKGAFPIGPVSDRSLFEIQAQKIRRLRRRTGQTLPWYVMTSAATDAATRAFFDRHDHFGIPRSDIFVFRQGMVPSFDFEDRLILAEPGRIAENPDGHGGSLTALLESGALDDLEHRGVTTLFYYQVDNPLVRMADPTFLGFHAMGNADVSCKVVRKVDPLEKVGVLARIDGAVGVVEYSELAPDQRDARDARGDLLFWAGNVAIHAFEISFVRRIAAEADRWLPFHASKKEIPMLDEAGRRVEPAAPNGRKLERFVFDALPAAKNVCVVETTRAHDFSPVKNAEGVDSAATARRDLVAQYAGWLEAAGLEPPPGRAIEIDHSQVDCAADLQALGVRNLSEAADIVRIAPGAHA